MSESNGQRQLGRAPTKNAGPPAELKILEDASLALQKALKTLLAFEFDKETQQPDVVRGIDFYDEVRRFESALIREALRQTRGHQLQAALLLGLKPTTLNGKIRLYKINPKPLQLDG